MVGRCALLLGVSFGAAVAAHGQEESAGAAGQEEVARRFFEQLEAEGITLDLEHREVRVGGVFRRTRPDPEHPIELGLVTPEGSVHESLGVVECTKPSLINACLLMLGLAPGSPRRYLPRDPAPSEEDLEIGLEVAYVVQPPRGDRVFIYVHWIDDAGNERILALEDLLISLESGETIPMRGFVFIGSRFVEHLGKEIYAADSMGEVALVFPDKVDPRNCILDVYAADAAAYNGLDVDPRVIPPAGTRLEFVFTPVLRPDSRPLEPVGTPAAPVADAATLAARSRSPYLVGADAAWLARIGERDLADYKRMLRRGRPQLRETISALLGVSGSPEAAELLGRQLRSDRSGDVRLASAFALAELADPAAVEQLILTLDQPWWLPRDDALFALRLLSGENRGRRSASWRVWARARFPDNELFAEPVDRRP